VTSETDPPRVAETHVSLLFFVGDRVYKLKKPVKLDFLDFSTRSRREAACRREVELNRRLAPDVYLGVSDVSGTDGKPCDHLVVMRRMPDDRRLSTLVQHHDSVDDCVRETARVIAAFHAGADTSPAIATAGSVAAVRANWQSSFGTLEPFVGSVLDPALAERVEALAMRYLDGREPLFAARVSNGKVRDGHGDLLADDIFCLDDGPRVLDCIEFSDRLRYGDVLADVAFLAMDLERVGAPEVARRFLGWYREFSAESYPETLAHHYIAYRAHVRAKVACLRAGQGDASAPDNARQLLQLAHDHLARGRVVLTLVGGLPGTGKSTLAVGLADRLGWTVLRSDELRKDLAGLDHAARGGSAYGEGLYDESGTTATYRMLLERAKKLLELGEPVILDASWSADRWRDEARALARATATDLVELRCDVPRDVARERLVSRARHGTDPSDATSEVADRMAADADPWPTAITVDTSLPRSDAVAAAVLAVSPRSG
jgi:aminoglycoside phosphotransferase family enzyme/predicted kinase